jgi:hypothetical protein
MLKKLIFLSCLAAFSSLSTVSSHAIAQNSTLLTIPKVTQAPRLQDFLRGVPANAGMEVRDFKQRSPGDGNAASKETKVYLSYDEQHFYAVFVAKDDPALVRSRIAKREDIEGDDLVILELDTFKDLRRAFVFEANPLGVQLDAKRTEGQDMDYQFNTQWESEGQLTEDGYVVKMAIPFKSLRFENADVQNWGVLVGRLITRLNEESFWPYVTKRISSIGPQMASMQIPEKISAGRNAQLIPFVYAGKAKLLNSEDLHAPFWQRENKLQGGLDAKWVLGEAAALDLTLKPDFSEVESDEPRITVGKRYEVEFPETRPFFLENAGFFKTPNPLFFSRRIVEPKAGLRLTGRKDSWSYGGLMMDDHASKSDATAGTNVANESAKIAMLRLQNDVNEDLQLGVLMTNKRANLDRHFVAGLDGTYQFDDNWEMQVQLASSQTDHSQSTKSKGQLRYVDIKHEGKHLEFVAKYLDISPKFDTNLAFLPRTDLKQLKQETKYVWHIHDHSWLQQIGPVMESEYTRDHANRLQDWKHELGMFALAKGHTVLEAKLERGMERFNEVNYYQPGMEIEFSSSWFDWLQVESEVNWTKGINYQATSQVKQLLGDARSVQLTMQFKPHAQWRIEEKLLWNDLRNENDSPVFKNVTWRTKLNYQHNRFLGLRLIFDYQMLKSNPALTTMKSGKQLNTDVQLSYVLSPGTTLYAGYGNRQENLAWLGNPTRLQRTEDLNLRTGSRFFIKFNYLFQL